MNELDLIKEVEKRPILYDKSVSGFNKTKLRDEAWKEVQEALNVTESECKKRWRSLRDSFIKLQRTHGGRTRWPYHIAMRFLLPHLEPKGEISPQERHTITSSYKRDEDSDPEETEVPPPRLRAMPSLPDLSFPSQEAKPYEDDDDDSQPSPKKARVSSPDDEVASSCQCNRSDPDELFLLSCAPILKRLNARQNAGARLKIQQVLYEAEFGQGAPYVTPSEGYEPIDSVE